MRIFVTGAGRCGSVTFAKACAAITNYTCAHESQREKNPPWDYPDNHIEVDCRLTWQVPMLLKKYPDARWVILDRNRDLMALSWAKRQGTMLAWRRLSTFGATDRFAGATHYVEYVYAALDAMLPAARTVRVSTPVSPEEADWLWSNMEAEGDFGAFVDAFHEVHNAS